MSDLPGSTRNGTLLPDESSADRQAVLAELGRILESPEFHSSPRCQEFLKYVVEKRLEGAADLLKERNIGVDVFHRRPSYEPNADAIVRVRATEVRKRLAQYYEHAGSGQEVRIQLASGSYVPEFRPPSAAPPALETPPEAAPPVRPRVSRWWMWAAPLLGLAGIAAGLWIPWNQASSPLREFWRPTLESPKPVVICLGQPVVYHLSRRVHENYLKTLPGGRLPGPYIIPLRPGDVDASDILPVPDQYVGSGSAQAAARLSALLAGWGKQSQIRVGNEFSFYDLRNSPAVLEGAFSNDWTMKLNQSMPFVFFQEQGVRGIRERGPNGRVWRLTGLDSAGRTSEDFAVAGRVFDSGTMEPLIVVAGITQYGTQAAGEFIADEHAFAEAMASAPPDWRRRNVQILLHLHVIGKLPGKPEVLAVRTW
jgi:hypothetical protein